MAKQETIHNPVFSGFGALWKNSKKKFPLSFLEEISSFVKISKFFMSTASNIGNWLFK